MERYNFKNSLLEGIVKSRPNRFIMKVELDNSLVKCHCPSTGRVGNILFEDVPCLLSRRNKESRKTNYTVEAISFDPVEKKNKSWVGINQTKINTYVSHFLETGQLSNMVPDAEVQRERPLGNSRIDFQVGDAYLEIKMPLINLPSKGTAKSKKSSKFNSFKRLIKHFNDLSSALESNKRAIVALCYQYDAEPFEPPARNSTNERISTAAEKAHRKGVENWQINMKIDRKGASLLDYFKLSLF